MLANLDRRHLSRNLNSFPIIFNKEAPNLEGIDHSHELTVNRELAVSTKCLNTGESVCICGAVGVTQFLYLPDHPPVDPSAVLQLILQLAKLILEKHKAKFTPQPSTPPTPPSSAPSPAPGPSPINFNFTVPNVNFTSPPPLTILNATLSHADGTPAFLHVGLSSQASTAFCLYLQPEGYKPVPWTLLENWNKKIRKFIQLQRPCLPPERFFPRENAL